MLSELKKDYFSKPISLFIEIVFFILLPVLIFLNFPNLLPFRTIYIICSFSYICYYFKTTKLPINSSLGITKSKTKKSIIFSLFLTFISTLLLIVLLNIFPDLKTLGLMIDRLNGVSLSIFIPLYLLVSIPLQELIFRGFFISRLKLISDKKGVLVLASSLIFTLMHLAFGEVILLPFAFLFGVLLALLQIKYNNIIGPIVYHSAMGVIALMLVL